MLLTVLAATLVVAQDISRKVDDYIAAEMKAQKVPGLSLAVVKSGTLIKLKSYGFANLEDMVPVHVDTLFQSGSLAKQFTAAGVLLLVEEGKVGLDDPISKYFANSPPAWKDIKVRNLLSHTSGIPEYEEGGSKRDFHLDYSEDQLLAMAQKMPLDFAPGAKWKYSNTGFTLLGILIHKLTGEFYGDFLREHIWQPLAMETTQVIDNDAIIPNRAQGYNLVKGELKHTYYVSPTLDATADGSLLFSAIDLVKWDAALRARKVLKPASYEAWWTPMKLNDGSFAHYGFGWFIESAGGQKVIEHTGEWQGFQTQISRYGDDLTVIVLVNCEDYNPKKLAHAVGEMYGAAEVK
jgi:CubicO group peptidase (beta-lactamase class C family)